MGHKRQKCSFTGCTNTKAKYPNLHFFKFPVKRKEVCNDWLLNCANENLDTIPYHALANRVVCDQHFTKKSFTNDMRVHLTVSAVPTLLSQNVAQSKETLTTENPEISTRNKERLDILPAVSSLMTQNISQSKEALTESPVISTSNKERLDKLPAAPTLLSQNVSQTTEAPTENPVTSICNEEWLDIMPAVEVTIDSSQRSSKMVPVFENRSTPSNPLLKKSNETIRKQVVPKMTFNEVNLKTNLNLLMKEKKRLMLKLKRLQNKVSLQKSKEQLIEEELAKLPCKVSVFIKMQLRHYGILKQKNKNWREDEIEIAIGFRKHSPALYEQMRRDGFALPSRATIARWLKERSIQPKVSSESLPQVVEKESEMLQCEEQTSHNTCSKLGQENNKSLLMTECD